MPFKRGAKKKKSRASTTDTKRPKDTEDKDYRYLDSNFDLISSDNVVFKVHSYRLKDAR